MKAPFRRQMIATVRAALVLGAVGIACGSCSEQYLARRDSLAPGTGDAVQANIAVQVIDPWPPHAQVTRMTTDGQRAEHAMRNFRNPSTANSPSAPAPAPVGANSGGVSRDF